ncbi:hypothetical protein EAU56_16135 [Salmonella enterica]|nr:hypothetical protein LFZ4_12040 [Salmonella enterica subsp. enterica serovar Antsalova str. S01-0511]EAP3546291.1 hypothetical protein [Salmonella enterica]ELE9440881.1 hypothetical protein [Salmonella enterica subsp. enterica serovar Nima]EHN2442821.1 hypothetical protein [Salmonella enterica]EIL5841819.1 hypothetical protein [Salmonella enterica]
MFCRDADLFTQQKRASPRDGLITQSTRKAVTAGALFCFVEKPTGGGNRHLEGLTMNDDCDIRWRRFDVAAGPLYAVPPKPASNNL